MHLARLLPEDDGPQLHAHTGSFIQKVFLDGTNGRRPFLGRVGDHDDKHGYLVTYVDGDTEHMDSDELEGLLLFDCDAPAWLSMDKCGLRQQGTGRRRPGRASTSTTATASRLLPVQGPSRRGGTSLQEQWQQSNASRQFANLEKIVGDDVTEDVKQTLMGVFLRLADLERREAQLASRLASSQKREKAMQLQLANREVEPELRPFCFEFEGKGFNAQRTLQKHVQKAVEHIQKTYSNDVAKQVAVVAGLAEKFGIFENMLNLRETDYLIDGRPITREEVEVCVAIGKAFRTYCLELRRVHPNGRYPNEVCTALRASAQAAGVVTVAPAVSLERRHNFTKMGINTLKVERRRFKAFLKGFETDGVRVCLLKLRGARRGDAYPEEWRAFVVQHWQHPDITRRSEKARDVYIDKADRKSTVPRYLLETRQCVAIKKIQRAVREAFDKPYDYADGVVRRFPEKGVGITFIQGLRPFNVKQCFGDRETSLCRYHMSWEFIAAAMWSWAKQIRERGLVDKGLPMTVPKDAYLLRRALVCPRTDPDSDFDNIACRDEKCELCKDLGLLCNVITDDELSRGRHIELTWEKWEKWEDSNGRKREDHRTQAGSNIDAVLNELRRVLTHKKHKPTMWQDFKLHHDLMKYMERNKAHTRRNFLQGSVHVIEDYSENGELGRMKKEHASRYFETRPYTLFGMVVDSHVEDRLDLDTPEKERLIAIMEKHHPNEPHILTEMHVVLTEDCHHDPAAVMYFNDNLLIPHLKATIDGFERIHYCCDGAPTQFDNVDMYNWASKCKAKHGVICDWVIGCPAHNKDLSDGECGLCKNCVNRVNLEHEATDVERQTKIDTVPQVMQYLEATFTRPQKDLAKKQGRGVYRRIFHHVPLRTISRRVPSVKTLDGSKKRHQFVDTGKPGRILWRRRPCHVCDGCLRCDHRRITKECRYNDVCGRAQYKYIKSKGKTNVVVTRARSAEAGLQFARDACVGDFVAVQVAGDELPWVLCEVVEGHDVYRGDAVDTLLSKVNSGDLVLTVRRWLPLEAGGGCSLFQWTDEKVLVQGCLVIYLIKRQGAKKTFKLQSAKTKYLECSEGHKLIAKAQVNNACDVCSRPPTAWSCPAASCNYNICVLCKELKERRRRLQAKTKKAIFAAIPNCEADAFEGNDGGDDWYAKYTTKTSGMTIIAVATELEVSIRSLIDHNGMMPVLEPTSVLRKGTELWAPGPKPADWVSEEDEEDAGEEKDEELSSEEEESPLMPSSPPSSPSLTSSPTRRRLTRSMVSPSRRRAREREGKQEPCSWDLQREQREDGEEEDEDDEEEDEDDEEDEEEEEAEPSRILARLADTLGSGVNDAAPSLLPRRHK